MPSLRLLLLLMPLLLSACAKRPAGDAVKKVSFEGNRPGFWGGLVRPQTDRALRNAIAHPKPRELSLLLPRLIEPAWVDPKLLEEDAWRVEVFYANHGYFDARFLGWELWAPPEGRRRLRPVRIVGHVEEGEPSTLRTLRVDGLETLQAPTRRRLVEALGLAEGDIFDTEVWRASVDGLRGRLLEQSFAFAEVDGRVDVYPEEHRVDAVITAVPGPRCRFGEVTISGLRTVPRKLLEDTIAVKEGRAFRASDLATTRSRLFGLGVFSIVNVTPDLSDPAAAVVPVRIDVREVRDFRELEAGVGLSIEPGTGTTFVEATISDDNILHRLWRGELRLRPGLGVELGGLTGEGTELFASPVRPIGIAEAKLEVPRVAGPDWSVGADGRVELGMEPGYRFFSPSVSPTITWKGIRRFTATAGWELTYFDYTFDPGFDLSGVEDSPLGLDLTDPYLLSQLVQRFAYDGRNDPLYTTRGWFWSVALGEAVGGNFHFVKGEGEVRVYRSIVELFGIEPNTVVAGRVGGGLIVPYGSGEKASVPHAERLYLGGGSSVRGWVADHLGPWEAVWDEGDPDVAGDDGEEVRILPVGGNVSLFGTFEVRQQAPLFPDLSIAAFTDVGRVWDRPANFGLDELQWSAGGGLRYRTPIGPVRLDVATRLNSRKYFDDRGVLVVGEVERDVPAEPRVTFHFGLSEAF